MKIILWIVGVLVVLNVIDRLDDYYDFLKLWRRDDE